MALIIPYTPTSIISKALFNFDVFGITNFKLTGTVNVSVSDSFTYAQYRLASTSLSNEIYTSLSTGKTNWIQAQLDNINLIVSNYSNFINLSFSPVINDSGKTPAEVGNTSDINISVIYRTDLDFSGRSALGDDTSFGYTGSRGDIVLNLDGFGSRGLSNDYSLNLSSFSGHALMHEIGHSLGLSHPHLTIVNDIPTITTDFAATTTIGFDKLGFHISRPLDMNKEYFTVMSYDDQVPPSGGDTFAQNPMILDVIALQTAYGEGHGSSGSGDDVIAPGGNGGVNSYRSYFDTGGTDTIDLVNYSSGAYLHMGTTITGAAHPVGVSMSMADKNTMDSGSGPASLRWFYGEFENAKGSASADLIYGNALDNIISGGAGNDTLSGGEGNDTLDGGAGIDTAIFSGKSAEYTVVYDQATSHYTVKDSVNERDGANTLISVENLQFSDVTGLSSSFIALSKSKVFMSNSFPEVLTLADSGITVYGGLGTDIVSINSGANNIILDQNIDRINLPGAVSDFKFRQAGNELVAYDSTGTMTIVTIPVQADTDGTQIGFNNGSTYDAKFNTGHILIGGATVDSNNPSIISPSNTTATNTTVPASASSAKVFMGNNDFFTVSNSGVTVYGNSGSEIITVSPGTANITFDQNIEKINFSGAESNYKFMQTGNQINIYDADGTTLLAKGPVQGDADGTLLAFSNATGSAIMASGGVMLLGGAAVSSIIPAAL